MPSELDREVPIITHCPLGSQGGRYQLWVALSEADMEALNSFTSLDGHVEDALHVLVSMVEQVVPLYDSTHLSLVARFENYISMDLTSLCKVRNDSFPVSFNLDYDEHV